MAGGNAFHFRGIQMRQVVGPNPLPIGRSPFQGRQPILKDVLPIERFRSHGGRPVSAPAIRLSDGVAVRVAGAPAKEDAARRGGRGLGLGVRREPSGRFEPRRQPPRRHASPSGQAAEQSRSHSITASESFRASEHLHASPDDQGRGRCRNACNSRRRTCPIMNSGTCDVNPALVEKLKAFRLNQSKATRAFVVKIDKLQIIEDKVLDPTTWEDLQDELPDTQPRYVVVSFERTSTDGRVSYPLVFIYYVPESANMGSKMIYSSGKTAFSQAADLGSKVVDVQELEKINYDYVVSRLA